MNEFSYYDLPNSCNKCGEGTYTSDEKYEESHLSECKTECKTCGFVDYWAYGVFESSQDGYKKCHKYYFKDGKMYIIKGDKND